MKEIKVQITQEERDEINTIYCTQEGVMQTFERMQAFLGNLQDKRKKFWSNMFKKYNLPNGTYYVDTVANTIVAINKPRRGKPSVTITDNTPQAKVEKVNN